MKDTTRAPQPEDGIFFPSYKEGIPGIQPERLGPYTSTFNPGYDSSLPLYKPWPMFYAIQAINSTPVKPFKIESKIIPAAAPYEANITEVQIISGPDSPLKDWLSGLGVPFTDAAANGKPALIIIDGSSTVAGQRPNNWLTTV